MTIRVKIAMFLSMVLVLAITVCSVNLRCSYNNIRIEKNKIEQENIEYKAKIEFLNNKINSIIDKHASEVETLQNKIQELEEQLATKKEEEVIKKPKFEINEECDVPSVNTHVKLYTDYRFYNIWYTPHYRLQQVSWTDEQGCRRFNDDYIVALGSYYSTDIGDRFEVTLDTGRVFTVILGDGKWDIDCDERNMYTPCASYDGLPAGNLLEFIIDDTMVSNGVISYGSLDYYENFKGNVVKMVYLGRDTSADWDTYETI